jgi:hypothetical protein
MKKSPTGKRLRFDSEQELRRVANDFVPWQLC